MTPPKTERPASLTPDTPATEAWMQAAGVEIARQVWHMTAIDKAMEFTAIIARHHATRPVAPTARPEQPAAPDVAALANEVVDSLNAAVLGCDIPKAERAQALTLVEDILTPALSALVSERDAKLAQFAKAGKWADEQLAKLREERDAAVAKIPALEEGVEIVSELEAALTASRERESRLVDMLREAADSVHASLAEDGISEGRKAYRKGLEDRICALLTPPPAGTEKTL